MEALVTIAWVEKAKELGKRHGQFSRLTHSVQQAEFAEQHGLPSEKTGTG